MTHSVNFSVIIPSRLQSTRLANKALADIHGKPMIVWVAEQAQKSHADKVVVATDSHQIEAVCAQYNIQCVLTDAKHQSGTDRLAEAVQILNIADEHLIINVQGDEPLIEPNLINQLAQHLANCTADMATLAHPIVDSSEFNNPNVVKVLLNRQHEALYFSRATIPYQRNKSLLLPYLKHIGLYAYRASFLKTYHQLELSDIEQVESLEQLRVLWHGYKISVLVTEEQLSIGVDTEEDLQAVIKILNPAKE